MLSKTLNMFACIGENPEAKRGLHPLKNHAAICFLRNTSRDLHQELDNDIYFEPFLMGIFILCFY